MYTCVYTSIYMSKYSLLVHVITRHLDTNTQHMHRMALFTAKNSGVHLSLIGRHACLSPQAKRYVPYLQPSTLISGLSKTTSFRRTCMAEISTIFGHNMRTPLHSCFSNSTHSTEPRLFGCGVGKTRPTNGYLPTETKPLQFHGVNRGTSTQFLSRLLQLLIIT